MKARPFDPGWYARVMKNTTGAIILVCGATGSGVRLFTHRRFLGHNYNEVLADRAEGAMRLAMPAISPDDDPMSALAAAKNKAAKAILDDIRAFAAGAPAVIPWTSRNLGNDPDKFDLDNLGVPTVLIDEANAVLYIISDRQLTDDLRRCWVLKDDYSAESRSKLD